MKAQDVSDYFNRNFVDDQGQIKPAHFDLTIKMMSTGEAITLPGIKVDDSAQVVYAAMYLMFGAVNDYLKENRVGDKVINNTTPGAASKAIDVTEIMHNKKMYFVELRDTGEIIIQDEKRQVIQDGAAYNGVMKKYHAKMEGIAPK